VRALVDTLDVAWRHTLPAAISRRLPHRRLALFESDAGRTAAGDPRAISERLHAERPDIDQAWVYRDTPDEVPPFAEPVRRHGVRHHWRANRARLWVDDGLASLWIAKPPRTTALLTPPPPVHRIGLDDPGVLVRGPAVRNLARRYRRYDLTAAPSVGAGQRVVDALAMSATPVACGIPRVDAALALRRERDALRRNLGLPDDRAIVVYAPTARALGDVVDATSPLDLAAWSRLLGTRAYLVVHPHPQQAQAVADRLRPWVRHVASHYSSVIALALALDAPVVLHQPDRVEYLNRIRGVYPQRGAPGPVVEDLDALVAAVVDVIDRPDEWRRTWAADRTLLAAGLCGPVDGESSARAVTAAIDASGMAGR
jgi:CDP-glycerol glycerophosphotransferase